MQSELRGHCRSMREWQATLSIRRYMVVKKYLLVEGNWVAEERVDDVGVVVQFLVDHEGEDAHLGGAAIVELDGEFSVDGLFIPS